jgi:hypothetical protein
MAMTATLVQTKQANMGSPCSFVLTVLNSDAGSAVNIYGMGIRVTAGGLPATSCNIGEIQVAPGLSTPNSAGSNQYNIVVAPSGSVAFPFSVAFFGPAVAGNNTNPQSVFNVFADIVTSDGATFTPPPLSVPLNMPTYGQPPGAPPNRTPPTTGALQFYAPQNSAFAL